MQAQGLFSGVNPDLIAQQEQLAKQKTNLDLAQASNPFASTMFAGLNMADQFKNQVADVFGNPLEESAAVKAAKEEKALEQEVAAMVMQGRQEGKDNATIAQEVQQYLMSRGKFQKAEQARMQQMTEEQTAAKSAAEVTAKNAAAAKDNAQAAEAQAKTAFMQSSLEARKKGIKARYPNLSEDIINAAAQDEKVFADLLKGAPSIETAEGVLVLQPDGTYKRVGSVVDRRNNVSLSVGGKGNEAYIKQVAESLPEVEQSITNNNRFISQLQGTMKRAAATIANNDRYTGGLGEGMLAVASSLNSLGLLSPAEREKVIKSQEAESELANILLAKTGGKIGAGFSNVDLNTVKAGIGQAMNDPKALFNTLLELERITKEANEFLRERYNRGVESIKQGQPLPLDKTFDTPEMKTGGNIVVVPKERANDKGYIKFLESQGKVVKVQ